MSDQRERCPRCGSIHKSRAGWQEFLCYRCPDSFHSVTEPEIDYFDDGWGMRMPDGLPGMTADQAQDMLRSVIDKKKQQ